MTRCAYSTDDDGVEPVNASRAAVDLQRTIEEIGLARFVGRINSGVIATSVGYEAVEIFVDGQRHRPVSSTISKFLFGRPDSFVRDSK